MGKRKSEARNLGGCAYCPADATTKDHVPPKGMFAKGMFAKGMFAKGMFAKGMPDKPWVPACESCNSEASLDDEYMQRLSMLWGADDCADAVEVGEKFMRSLERQEARGLQAEVRQSLSPLDDESLFPGGVNIALQGDRLGRLTDKLVRGWWFKLVGERLPEEFEIMKYVPGTKHSNQIYEVNEELIERCPGFTFGDMAFTFRLAYCPNSLLTCWRFKFYKVFEIMAYTCRVGDEEFQLIDLTKPFSVINFDS